MVKYRNNLELSHDAHAFRESAACCGEIEAKATARLRNSQYLQRAMAKSEEVLEKLEGKTIGKYGSWESGGIFEKYKDRNLVETIQKMLEVHHKLSKGISDLDKLIAVVVVNEQLDV